MKIQAKDIKVGMKIKYVGHKFYTASQCNSALCGSVKSSSPVINVERVQMLVQRHKNLNTVLVTTNEGIEIHFSTRIKVEVIN